MRRYGKADVDDFLRRSREVTGEITKPSHSNSRGWKFANSWEEFIDGRENWLVAPLDFSKNFIAAPYAWGESVPLANLRVLREEADEDGSWAFFATPGFTTGGGYLAFDSSDYEIVELLAEFEAALDSYPLLDDEAHSEVEREMWGEAIADWLVDDFKRDVVHSDEMRSISSDGLTELVLDSVDYLDRVIEAILWGQIGYVSADDIHFDKGAVSSFSDGLAQFVDSMKWADLKRELSAEEIAAEFEAQEFQFLVDVDEGWIDYHEARKMGVEFRKEARQ